MAETNDFPVLSPMAVQRQQAMLPSLLGAVRQRRQRRRAVRTAALLSAVVLVALLVRPWLQAPQRADERPREAAQPAFPSWSTLHDDPTVLARCEVRPAVRAEWFVDDARLHDLLAAADREAGLVRAGGRVRVSAAAIDRWGSEMQ